MGLRIVVDAPGLFTEPLEDAIRQTLGGALADVEVFITPAMDRYHAEVMVSASGFRRGAYYAPLCVSAGEHVRNLCAVLCVEPLIQA